MATKIKGGGARKYNRNKDWCAAYKSSGKQERSKAQRIIKHLWRAPWDGCARAALDRLPALARKGMELPPLAKSPAAIRAFNGVTLTALKRAA